jgi:hypothetical protein
MPILAILFGGGLGSSHSNHKAVDVGPQSGKGVSSRHKLGRYPGCKVMVLQPNRVGSWR